MQAAHAACRLLDTWMISEITLYGSRSGAGAQVVVVGLPYSRGTTQHRQGAADGPDEIRKASQPFGIKLGSGRLVDLASGEAWAEGELVSDLGNIRFIPEKQTDDDYLTFVSQASEALFREQKQPLFLGGDHLITLAILRGLKACGQDVQVVHLDAHSDLGEIGEGERPTHGTFMALVHSEELCVRVLQLGVRGLGWGEPKLPVSFYRVTTASLVEYLLRDVPVYLTVDTDAFDPSCTPGVSFPQPDGLRMTDLRSVLDVLQSKGLRLLGADWVEYNPLFDTSNRITAKFITYGLGLILKTLSQGKS